MKSEFLTPLLVEQISETDWRLFRPFQYASERLNRVVNIPQGFVTDFASVPRLPLVYWLTGGTTVKPAVVHDWLYRTCTATRVDADAVFAEAVQVSGQPGWRRVVMYAGLRVFGGSSYCTGKNPATSGVGNLKASGNKLRHPQLVICRTMFNNHTHVKELK